MRFEVYRSGVQYRWRLWAANNRKVADSGESYVNKQDCLNGIALVKSLTSLSQFEVYVDTANQWRWRVRAANGRIIADSGEGYSSRQACVDGANLVLGTSGSTPVVDSTLTIYR
jgi:uncharacterized protein YegP (UPF0339 family)